MSYRDAYFAGLMDGEGTWSIQVNIRSYKGRESAHFNPRMTMTLAHGTDVLYELADHYGGTVYEYDADAKWNLSRRALLVPATEAMLPYLRIKRTVAERFLEALAQFPTDRKDRRNGERSWDRDRVITVGHIATTLNEHRRGTQKPETLERLYAIYSEN
jgi:hypothetical protein